jgi:hypothetical protein
MASMDLGHLFSSFTCYVYSYENLKVKSIFKLENPLLLCNGTLNYNKISGFIPGSSFGHALPLPVLHGRIQIHGGCSLNAGAKVVLLVEVWSVASSS